VSDQTTARQKITNLLWWSIPSHDTAEAKAKAEQMLDDHAAEVRRQHTETLAPQQCPAGLHADWLVDSEYAHACPWCQIDSLRTDAAAELMPVWEAMYEPGNVSDYLIGYANDEAPAKAAAEAWMRSQSEVTGRLEWVPWGDVTPMPDGYDRWFELVQRHDDGIDTGTGITVRRRKDPAPAPATAPPAASHGPAGDRDGETGTEGAVWRVGDSAHPIADADNPTPLRWGLDDVLWGDDDSVIVLLSGPDLEPYWLELDPERAAVLRRNLAGPDGEEAGPLDTLPAWLHQRFAVNGPTSWERLDDGQRAYWEHQARAVRRAVDRGGFKDGVTSPTEETVR
jgi:hypothetical protein